MSWQPPFEGFHPVHRDVFVSLEFEWVDNRVLPGRVTISLDDPSCPLSYQEIQEWAVEEAYKEMQDAFPHPQQEFSGAWTIR